MNRLTRRILHIMSTMTIALVLFPGIAWAETGASVASTGGSEYSSLQAAFDNANVGDTVVLLDDMALQDAIVVGEGSSITLDLAGHSIGYAGGAAPQLFSISGRDASLTIVDSGQGQGGSVYMADASDPDAATFAVCEGAALDIRAGYIGGASHCVRVSSGSTLHVGGALLAGASSSNIQSDGGTIEICDGASVDASGGELGIELLGGDTLTISGGEIGGATGIHQVANASESSTITISGGSITCRSTGHTPIWVESVASIGITGGAIGSYHLGKAIVAGGDSVISVSGGRVFANQLPAIELSGNADVSVTGGEVFSDGAGGNGVGILNCGNGTVTIGTEGSGDNSSPAITGVVASVRMESGTLEVFSGEIYCRGYYADQLEGGIVVSASRGPVNATIQGGLVEGPYGVCEFDSAAQTAVTICSNAMIKAKNRGSAVSTANGVISLEGGYVSDSKPETVEALVEGKALRLSEVHEGYYEVFEPHAALIAESAIYTGSDYSGTVNVLFDGEPLESSDYVLSYYDAKGMPIDIPKNVGTYVVTAAPANDAAWAGSASGAFRILPAEIAACEVSAPEKTYDGAPKTIDGITFNGATLCEGVDYEVSYQNNVDVGTARATITGMGNFTGTLDVSFDIAASAIPMHRLYNPWSGEHFYTASESERDTLLSAGWTYEGVGWYAPLDGAPVYRLYNPWAPAGDHHYTMSESEYEQLQKAGWVGEGVCWFSDLQERTPVWREYNPWQQANNHNYTASRDEHDLLVGIGWTDEAVGWYGV